MMNKIYLWENDVPYFNPEFGQEPPSITEYFLDNGKENGCVLVIPGGGYGFVCIDHEGDAICRFLNANGISAAYLNYRIAPYKHPVMETDARRAIRLIRYNAKKWGIDPEKIGTLGFSAGGHLTCMTGLRFDYGLTEGDEIDRISSRPDTFAPCYAVASLNPEITHEGTLHNLLGENPDEETIRMLSSENIVREDTPPVFLWHTAEDKAVNPECSLRFASSLIKAEIPCELHIFPYGGHGLGTAENQPLVDSWLPLFVKWFKHHNSL